MNAMIEKMLSRHAIRRFDDLFAAANVLLGYADGDLPHAKPRRPGRILREGAEKSSLREIAF